jgi:hypothetical protein
MLLGGCQDTLTLLPVVVLILSSCGLMSLHSMRKETLQMCWGLEISAPPVTAWDLILLGYNFTSATCEKSACLYRFS